MRKSPLPSITKGRDFGAAFRHGKYASSLYFSIHAHPNGLDHTRLGIQTSRRVGGAVVRNRLRRVIKESCRYMADELTGPYDIVIVVRPSAGQSYVELGFFGTSKELRVLFKRLGLI